MSSYDEELRNALKAEFAAGHLYEVGDCTAVFSALANRFPPSGSKIDWASIPNSIEDCEGDAARQPERFSEFFDEMCRRFRLEGPVLYVGDSSTDFTLEGSTAAMRRAVPELLQIPQHHYFVGPDCSWCISMTMEGDMAFARADK